MQINSSCMYRTLEEINLSAYAKNMANIRAKIPEHTRIMAIVKADAYGHGAIRIAKAAIENGASYLGVAWLAEAVQLRQAGINAPILILSETPYEVDIHLVDYDITQTIYSYRTARCLNDIAANQSKKVKIHVKIDTGMGRVGCLAEDSIPLIEFLLNLPHIEIEGIYTHFAKADDALSDYTLMQYKKFQHILSELNRRNIHIPIKHAANSDATHHFPETHLDMVRIGLSLYENILTLKSRVSYVKQVPKHSSISYQGSYTTDTATMIATVQLGYADGYPRELSNIGRTLIKGKSYPIRGKVTMDMLMVDLGDNNDNITAGDEVVLIGNQGHEKIEIREICEKAQKIPYEIMCGINKRVERIYIHS